MFKLLRNLNKKDWIFVIICILFVVFQVYVELKMPDFMANVTTALMEQNLEKNERLSEIWKNGGFMLLCAFSSLVSAFIIGYLASIVAASFARITRKKIYDKVSSFSMEEINKFSTSSLITRSTNDITQVQMVLVLGLQLLVKAPVMVIWALFKIYDKNITWTSITGYFVLGLIVMISFIMILAIPRFKRIQALTDDLNRVTRENLTGIRVVRAYNAEGYQEEKFADVNTKLTNNHLSVSRALAILAPTMSIIMSGISLAIYWSGAYMINDAASIEEKATLFADMSVFSSYSIQIIMSFMMLIMIFVMLPRAIVSAKRINDVLKEKTKIHDGKGVNADKLGTVVFNNVSFKYPDAEENILSNISFEANKGEVVAFIGSTGSGKSTLINLIPRFYDVTSGEILVDGYNVKDYKKDQLLDKIGYISQKAVLFKGTIKSNILFGKDEDSYNEDALYESASIAQASEFIEKIEKNYDYEVSQGGSNLSGGQKQRISIARAIAKDPEIFIFDDSFSALDYKTDKKLRKELDSKMKDKTRLIVAQRIGTIIDADKIIVLENGKMVGIGKHKDLLKNCDIYRQIAESQLSKEELGYE